MKQTIDRVLRSPELRQDMVKRGYAQVARYSWRRMAEETHAIYLKVLDKQQ